MRVGFTGTRAGMSQAQKDQLTNMLWAFVLATAQTDTPEFHHGGADGADCEAHDCASLLRFAIHVHPCAGVTADYMGSRDGSTLFRRRVVRFHEVFPPLTRNRHIVDAVQVLIAAPRTDKEEQRSGTWATIRYARKVGLPIVMLSREEGSRR